MHSRIIFSIVLGTAIASFAVAQAPPGSEDFASVKARHVERLQHELACVQAASSFAELQACRPARPEGRGGPPPEQKN